MAKIVRFVAKSRLRFFHSRKNDCTVAQSISLFTLPVTLLASPSRPLFSHAPTHAWCVVRQVVGLFGVQKREVAARNLSPPCNLANCSGVKTLSCQALEVENKECLSRDPLAGALRTARTCSLQSNGESSTRLPQFALPFSFRCFCPTALGLTRPLTRCFKQLT